MDNISNELAEELYLLKNGESFGHFVKVADQLLGLGRWREYRSVVFSVETTEGTHFYAFDYGRALTEIQDDDFPWYDCNCCPVDVYRVYPHEKTSVIFSEEP